MATLFRPWVYWLVEASYCQLCIFAGGQSPTGATLEQSKLEREAQYLLKLLMCWFLIVSFPLCSTKLTGLFDSVVLPDPVVRQLLHG